MANRFLIVCGGAGYKLLGQRAILGLDAELQVDVAKENVSQNWKVRDQRSLFVDLDKRVGTTSTAINALLNNYLKPGSSANKQQIERTKLLQTLFPSAQSLEYGLAQSPAIGYAAMSHENNQDALEQAIRRMITSFGKYIGPENHTVVWIVSSTAGGTGEGTHCFVARKLAEIFNTTFAKISLTINFIRIGQLTYRSINNDRTALNTFFGVAADSAFMRQVKNSFPFVLTNWFYVDLPDVGKGDKAKRVRGETVEMACKSIMLPDLQDDFQKLLANNAGAPIVLVKIGYWARNFGNNITYFETLKQLSVKLADLTNPNYQRKYIDGKPLPQFKAPELDDHIRDVQNADYVINRMGKGWVFPLYHAPGNLKYLEQVVALVSDWKNSMSDLIEIDIDHLNVEFLVDKLSPVGVVPLTVPAFIQEDGKWFIQINDAHRVKGWASHLLGLDSKERTVLTTGWIASLLQQASEISKIFQSFDIFNRKDVKARKACGLLGGFLKLLVQVNLLLELEKSATKLLMSELAVPREVIYKVNEEYEIAKNTIGSDSNSVTHAAELHHILDQLSRKTWLRLLRDAVHEGDTEQFREEVLRGATGLTEDGLRSVLGLNSKADIIDIQNTLATNMGRMVGENNQEYEGVWWQATAPNPTLEYHFRILPQVDRGLQNRLRTRAEEDDIPYRYIFTEFGTIGLKALALQCASLNQAYGDTVSASAFLLSPFVANVRRALNSWPLKPEPNIPSGQLQIVVAGNGGEPLYKDALTMVGLTSEEIAKINQYYDLIESTVSKSDKLSTKQKGMFWKETDNEIEEDLTLNEVKVLILGQGSVGKTSLVNQLIKGEFNPNETKTDGIEIRKWIANTGKIGGLMCNIWDFGGQEIMFSTHQFFLSKRSIYVLVLDSSRLTQEENRVEYWLKIIQSFGEDSPVLVVGNKVDQRPLDIDQTNLRNKYPNIVGIFETSATTGKGIPDLRSAIIDRAFAISRANDIQLKSWLDIKSELILFGRKNNFLAYDEYVAICMKNNVTDEKSQRMLISYLNDSGVVLYFHDNPRLEALGIFNPQWVTNGVYKILNSNELFQHQGQLTLPILNNILNLPEYPSNKRLFIVDIMKKFELCYDIEPDKSFLIPDVLPKDEPYTGVWDSALAFQIHYNFLPSSIISRFIVRMNAFVYKNVWRSGVILERDGNTALVKADTEDRKIYIWVNGDETTRRDFLSAIRMEFDAIHKTIAKIEATEKVPLPNYPNADPVDYAFLLQLERDSRESFPVNIDGKIVDINVRELLNGIRPSKNQTVKMFISYSHQDKSFARKLAGELESAGMKVWWDFDSLKGGQDWQKEIENAIKQCDFFLVTLTPDAITSEWVGNEITYANQAQKTIIPLHLKECEIPIGLIKKQYIDFEKQTQKSAIKELLGILKPTNP